MIKKTRDRALTPDQIAALEEIRRQLESFKPRPGHRHDRLAVILGLEAINAALQRNKGVAAIALIPVAEASLITEARRQEKGIAPYGRSGTHLYMVRRNERYFPKPLNVRHAEHVLTRDLDVMYHEAELGEVVTVLTSLEPCAKCLPQIIDCKAVKKVYYIAPDPGGGMVEAHDSDGILRLAKLPWNFQDNAANRGISPSGEPIGMTIGRAYCSAELRDLCWQIFLITDPEAGKRAKDHAKRVKALLRRTWKTLRPPTCACCGGKQEKLRCS